MYLPDLVIRAVKRAFCVVIDVPSRHQVRRSQPISLSSASAPVTMGPRASSRELLSESPPMNRHPRIRSSIDSDLRTLYKVHL